MGRDSKFILVFAVLIALGLLISMSFVNAAEEDISPKIQEDIDFHREKLAQNLEYTESLIDDGVIGGEEAKAAKDIAELAILDFDNIQEIIKERGSLDSIQKSIDKMKEYASNILLNKDAKVAALENLADLHFTKGLAILNSIPAVEVSIKKKNIPGTTVMVSAASGGEACGKSFPKIVFRVEPVEIINPESEELISVEERVTGWREAGEVDFRRMDDLEGLDSAYFPLFKQIINNNLQYSILKDFIRVSEDIITTGSLEELPEYREAEEEYKKATEYLEEVGSYFNTKKTNQFNKYRQVTLKLAQFYQIKGEDRRALLAYDRVLNDKTPLPALDKSRILTQKATIEANKKNLKQAVKYTKQAVDAYPLNIEAKEYQASLYKRILDIIYVGTSEMHSEALDVPGELLIETWDLISRPYSPADDITTILSENDKAIEDFDCRLFGLRVLRYAAEEGYDLGEFYYQNVPLPDKMYIEEKGELKIRNDFRMDWGELSSTTPVLTGIPLELPLYSFYGVNQRDEDEFGPNGENTELLDIPIEELVEYSYARGEHYQILRNKIHELFQKRFKDITDMGDYEKYIQRAHECVEHVIRMNSDIAFLAADANREKEIELLHLMGVYKPGVKQIPGIKRKTAGPGGMMITEWYIPDKHPLWKDYDVEKITVNSFVFKDEKHSQYKEMYKYTPISETWKDFWLTQLNPVNFAMILGPTLALKPTTVYIKGVQVTTNTAGAISLNSIRGLSSARAWLLARESFLGADAALLAGRVQQTSILGLRTMHVITKAQSGVRAYLMSSPVLQAIQTRSPWTFAILRTGAQIGGGATVGIGGFISAEIAGEAMFPGYGYMVSIPTAFVVDVLLGGVLIDYKMLKAIREVGIPTTIETGFIRTTNTGYEVVRVMRVADGEMDNLRFFLRSKGLLELYDHELPTAEGSHIFRTLLEPESNSLIVLRDSSTPEIIFDNIPNILRDADHKVIDAKAVTKEWVDQVLKARGRDIEDLDLDTYRFYEAEKDAYRIVYAQRTLEMLDAAGFTNYGPHRNGLYTLGEDIELREILDKGPGCCDSNVVWDLHEIIEGGFFKPGFEGTELYIRVDASGQAKASFSESALAGAELRSGVWEIPCEGEKVRVWGKIRVDANREAELITPRRWALEPYEHGGFDTEGSAIIAATHKVLRANGYFGRNAVLFDETLTAAQREIMTLRTGSNYWLSYDEVGEINHVLFELTEFDNKGRVILKDELPKKKLMVSSENGLVDYDPQLHPRIYYNLKTRRAVFVTNTREVKPSRMYGHDSIGRRIILLEDSEGRQLIHAEGKATLEPANPRTHGHYLYNPDDGSVMVEHDGRYVVGRVFDTLNDRIVYLNPETGSYFIKNGKAGTKFNLVKQEFELVESRPLGLREITLEGQEAFITESPIFVDRNTGETWVLQKYLEPEIIKDPVTERLISIDEGGYELIQALANDGENILYRQADGVVKIKLGDQEPVTWRDGVVSFIQDKSTGDVFILDELGNPREGLVLISGTSKKEDVVMSIVYQREDGGLGVRSLLSDGKGGSQWVFEKLDPGIHGTIFGDPKYRRVIQIDTEGRMINTVGIPRRMRATGVGAMIVDENEGIRRLRMRLSPESDNKIYVNAMGGDEVDALFYDINKGAGTYLGEEPSYGVWYEETYILVEHMESGSPSFKTDEFVATPYLDEVGEPTDARGMLFRELDYFTEKPTGKWKLFHYGTEQVLDYVPQTVKVGGEIDDPVVFQLKQMLSPYSDDVVDVTTYPKEENILDMIDGLNDELKSATGFPEVTTSKEGYPLYTADWDPYRKIMVITDEEAEEVVIFTKKFHATPYSDESGTPNDARGLLFEEYVLDPSEVPPGASTPKPTGKWKIFHYGTGEIVDYHPPAVRVSAEAVDDEVVRMMREAHMMLLSDAVPTEYGKVKYALEKLGPLDGEYYGIVWNEDRTAFIISHREKNLRISMNEVRVGWTGERELSGKPFIVFKTSPVDDAVVDLSISRMIWYDFNSEPVPLHIYPLPEEEFARQINVLKGRVEKDGFITAAEWSSEIIEEINYGWFLGVKGRFHGYELNKKGDKLVLQYTSNWDRSDTIDLISGDAIVWDTHLDVIVFRQGDEIKAYDLYGMLERDVKLQTSTILKKTPLPTTTKITPTAEKSASQIYLDNLFLSSDSAIDAERRGFIQKLLDEGWVFDGEPDIHRTPGDPNIFVDLARDVGEGFTERSFMYINAKEFKHIRGARGTTSWHITKSVESSSARRALLAELESEGYNLKSSMGSGRTFLLVGKGDPDKPHLAQMRADPVGTKAKAIVIGMEDKFGPAKPVAEMVAPAKGGIFLPDVTENFVEKAELHVSKMRIPKKKETETINAILEVYDDEQNLIHSMEVVALDLDGDGELSLFKEHIDALYPIVRNYHDLVFVEGAEDVGEYIVPIRIGDDTTKPVVYLEEGGHIKVINKETKQVLGGMEIGDIESTYGTGAGAKKYSRPFFPHGESPALRTVEGLRDPMAVLKEVLKDEPVDFLDPKTKPEQLARTELMAAYFIPETGERIAIIPNQNSLTIVRNFRHPNQHSYDILVRDSITDLTEGRSVKIEPKASGQGLTLIREGEDIKTLNLKDEKRRVFFDKEKRVLLEIKKGEGMLGHVEVDTTYHKPIVVTEDYILYIGVDGKQYLWKIGEDAAESVGTGSPRLLVDIVDPEIYAKLESESLYIFSPKYSLQREEFFPEIVLIREQAVRANADFETIPFCVLHSKTANLVFVGERFRMSDLFNPTLFPKEVRDSWILTYDTLYIYDRNTRKVVFEKEVDVIIMKDGAKALYDQTNHFHQIIIDSESYLRSRGVYDTHPGEILFFEKIGNRYELTLNSIRRSNPWPITGEEKFTFDPPKIDLNPETGHKYLSKDPVVHLDPESVFSLRLSVLGQRQEEPVWIKFPQSGRTMDYNIPIKIYRAYDLTRKVYGVYEGGRLRLYMAPNNKNMFKPLEGEKYRLVVDENGYLSIFDNEGNLRPLETRSTHRHYNPTNKETTIKLEPGKRVRIYNADGGRRIAEYEVNPDLTLTLVEGKFE